MKTNRVPTNTAKSEKDSDDYFYLVVVLPLALSKKSETKATKNYPIVTFVTLHTIEMS